MEHEPGDTYIRKFAGFIRANEAGLAQAAIARRRPRTSQQGSSFLGFGGGWLAQQPAKPVVLSISTHHLFYLLIRMEALGLNVGSLDIHVDSPSRPMSFINIFTNADKSDTLSLSSIRSSLSVVSTLSLGAGWWSKTEQPSVDDDIKYIFSSFTKIPALTVTAPTRKMIKELADDPPNQNALPLDCFKNIQILEVVDVDPRTLLGWDMLADSLITLKIRKSGVQDISQVFVGAVLDDMARHEGGPTRMRHRYVGNSPSRRGSFYASFRGSELPASVPEDEGEGEGANTSLSPTQSSPDATDNDPESPSLPSYKWSRLHFLSLPANDFTFFPTALLPLPPKEPMFPNVTMLDLSSNLLVSVPPCLSSLTSLRTLNLSDNMIDSVLQIYHNLGSIASINLSHNRLASICGLERLMGLEAVDLRENYIEESSEIGRLAMLPNIKSVFIAGNPLEELEDNYRVVCFDLFFKEGKADILIDGSGPGVMERRGLTSPPPQQMSSSRPLSTAIPASPPTVAVGHSHQHGKSTTSPEPSAPSSPPGSTNTSPQLNPVGAVGVVSSKGQHKKKKVKRIVDLDGGQDSDGGSVYSSRKHRRMPSDGSKIAKKKGKRKDKSPSPSSRGKQWGKFALPEDEDDPNKTPKASQVLSPPHTETSPASMNEASSSADPNPSSSNTPPPAISRHARHKSEMANLPSDNAETSSDYSNSNGNKADSTRAGVDQRPRNGTTRSAKRRARVTASVYDPPVTVPDETTESGEEIRDSAEAYRRRIEALKKDMGEGWLRVFSQTQAQQAPS